MRHFIAYSLIFALSLTMVPVLSARAEAPAYDLSNVEHIDQFVGSAGARVLLARNGFVVTDQSFKQIFEVYVGSGLPKFITTDSAWHTYHVLLEEGVRGMAEGEVARLKQFSAGLLAAALARSGGQAGPYVDLARFAGVGLALQDPDAVSSMDDRVKPAVQAALESIKGSDTPVKVLFFSLPVSGSRLRAAGFYIKSPALSGYFAARQWYAMCDFRATSEAETERAFRLAVLVEKTPELKALYAGLQEPLDKLVGPCDDADVRAYVAIAGKQLGSELKDEALADQLSALREAALKLPDPAINDQILLPDQYAAFARTIKGFRLLPSRRLPCAALFQNTVDPFVKGRRVPSGVDLLAAGALASDAGRRVLKETVKDEGMVAAILAAKSEPPPDSIHGQALRLLTELQKSLPTTAPAPLRTQAWQDKQLWTQLGAWVEERHTWALHAKMNVYYLGVTQATPGMVEPYPDFFSGLACLARSSASVLTNTVASPLDTRAAGKMILEFAVLDEKWKKSTLDPAEEESMQQFWMLYQEYESHHLPSTQKWTHAISEKIWQDLKIKAQDWAKGGAVDEIDAESLLALFGRTSEVPARLSEFAGLCDNVAVIARKQLSGEPLSEKDTQLIRGYGATLGRLHFYEGNSWESPKDDFPIVAPIYFDPDDDRLLYAGLPRPEALYVIVDVAGTPVLHLGAVLSYREFCRPTGQPLDDASWTEEVLRGLVPPPPVFTSSFRQAITDDEVIGIIQSGGIYEAIGTLTSTNITRALMDQLLTGEAAQSQWLVTSLCPRVGAADVGDLICVMEKTHPDHIGKLARRIVELPWLSHRDALYDLLRNPTSQYAEAAAFILCQKPEDINVSVLVKTYSAQSKLTQRLYCFLVGCIKQPNKEVEGMLLAALSDPEAGLRFEAAKALGRERSKTPQRVKALIDRIDDTNDYVAAAAARTLVLLNAKESAPAMLARLDKGVTPWRLNNEAQDQQYEAVFSNTNSHYGYDVTVLGQNRDPFGQNIESTWFFREDTALGVSLIDGLSAFVYTPAKKRLETMISSDYASDALDALKRIDPVGHEDRLVAVILDKQAPGNACWSALQLVKSIQKPELARRLLPVLDDRDPIESSADNNPWRRCDAAAVAIADMLKWEESIGSKATPLEEKDAFIAKLRKQLEGLKP